jgi:uncharacterized protein (TIGR02145 family)
MSRVKGSIVARQAWWVVTAVAVLAVGVANAQQGQRRLADDRDGKRYRTVKVGDQTWMAENLNHQTDNSWCYGGNASNCNKYGRLYNWNAAMEACPDGWRLPSSEDWNALAKSVGGTSKAGTKLKADSGWNGTDDFGFSAMPGGERTTSGAFNNVGSNGKWWTSTETNANNASSRSMATSAENINPYTTSNKNLGFSVRCVKEWD